MTLLVLLACGPKSAEPVAAEAPEAPVKSKATLPGLSCSNARVKVDFDAANTATVKPKGGEEQVFEKLKWSWDGHLTGTVQAEDFVFTYEDHYGCVRQAQLRVGGSEYSFKDCTGGTTADGLCYP